MAVHKLAGQPVPDELIINVPRLVADYYALRPDASIRSQAVSFGTSGHRGTSADCSFNEAHVLAITQAVAEYRASRDVDGPLFLAMDTHALSEPAFVSAVEVLAAHDVQVRIQQGRGYTPTPAVSHAILTYNRGRKSGLADGIVMTPSHNPPTDGGLKYNPPNGGPADTTITSAIQDRANQLLLAGSGDVKRVPLPKALAMDSVIEYDFVTPYVEDLRNVVDMDIIAQSGLRIGVDPMGGAGIHFWTPIAETYGVDIEVVNPRVDPTFAFMRVDWDGRIRMDCSSPHAMAGLIDLRDRFDVAFGNDPDFDRHGIVTPSGGLMNPNHYLAAAIAYLFQNRPQWPATAKVGKTLVSSAIIDRIAADLGRKLHEVPVGFKWFVDGLIDGSCGFAGEESAGASFLRFDGTVWTTDKDGIILDLLAAEITAKTGRDPALHYDQITQRFGRPLYRRSEAPATLEQKARLKALSAQDVAADELAGENIVAKLTKAPGNNAPIGGLKVVAENGWFAARPSGTEDIYKIYAESFVGQDHLEQILEEAKAIVNAVI